MDQKTRDHLQIAERNRDVARKLLDDQSATYPSLVEWAVIAMFYSAVHHVNAYLWERYHKVPRDHSERSWGVQQDSGISGCLTSYDFLKDAGYKARYDETYSLSEDDARVLLQEDLREVESTILRILGLPVPTW